MSHVKDTFTTLTSVNPSRYPEVYKMLLGYPRGYRMVVPYYHRHDPAINQRSFIVDISFDEDSIHSDLTKINNLEMRLEDNIQVSNQEEDKSVQLTGQAVTYPGFEPYEGDLFFMEIDNHQPVIMVVTSVEPTTYRQERFYRIAFRAYGQLTRELYLKIESLVSETCYFERKKYFGESQFTFLSSESWKHLRTLEKYRKSIAQDIVNFFYIHDYDTFFRPDGVYDPYVVEFLKSKLTVKDNRVHPIQLVVPLTDYHRSIWYKFSMAENTQDFSDVRKYTRMRYCDKEVFTSDYNALKGRRYLVLSDKGDTAALYPPLYDLGIYSDSMSRTAVPITTRYPRLIHDACPEVSHQPDRRTGYYYHYPWCPVCEDTYSTDTPDAGIMFNDDFYCGFTDSGTTPLMRITRKYLVMTREVDPGELIPIIKDYRKLGETTSAFYYMTLYLALTDVAIRTIS